MSTTTTTDPLRARLHGMWAAVAPSWAEHADEVDVRGAQLTEAMLARAAPQPGEHVLELACGAGGLGLAAAELVAPDGEVVLTDVAAEMTATAAARARERGTTNVSTRELDLEEIDAPDATFDVVLCREGLMFATDPDRAAREIARVLRPGGRAALAVWGPRERNPWLGLVLDAVSAQVGHPVPPPGVPGPFALSDAARLRQIVSGASLRDVAVEEIVVPMRTASFEEWWTRTSALAGPLSMILPSMPDAGKRALHERVSEAVAPYATAEGLAFPGVSLLVTGRRG
jgi:SAM-dependent methyltransferase